jgi:hypothetical protein
VQALKSLPPLKSMIAQSFLSGSSNGFALMAGGGVDFNFASHLAFRAVQADWFLAHGSGGTSSKNSRVSTGIVARF